MNTKLHAICDSKGRPIDLFVTAGQVSDYIGARALLRGLPKVKWLLGDRGSRHLLVMNPDPRIFGTTLRSTVREKRTIARLDGLSAS